MRIAVNTRLLLPGRLEGIGWFTHETLRRIVKAHPQHHFLFFFDRPFDPRFIYANNVEGISVWPPARHPLLYRMWFGRSLPAALRKLGAEALISPDGFLCLPSPLPQLAVIHDLNFEHHPEDLPQAYARYYRTFFPLFARKASRIVTVSEFSRQDIAKEYGIDPGNIDVAYNGVGDPYGPLTDDERSAVRARLTGGAPYFVSIGAISPRKNIARLLLAFDRFTGQHEESRLVLVGARMWWDKRMKTAWGDVQHKDRVIFTGRLQQKALHGALGAARALVFPSYFEGFGIPVAEAMRCGVPVIAAHATSLPEVAGDAALYCDPFSVDDMVRVMERMWNDDALRDRLSRNGIDRSARFNWDRTADALWSSFERMMHGTT
jgi:glycosyltransferase involved in cell wall biosynthesis